MDKKIHQMQKTTAKLAKEEKTLLKEDHKRDKVCELGKKVKAKKGKK
jgi:hypothetical protein